MKNTTGWDPIIICVCLLFQFQITQAQTITPESNQKLTMQELKSTFGHNERSMQLIHYFEYKRAKAKKILEVSAACGIGGLTHIGTSVQGNYSEGMSLIIGAIGVGLIAFGTIPIGIYAGGKYFRYRKVLLFWYLQDLSRIPNGLQRKVNKFQDERMGN